MKRLINNLVLATLVPLFLVVLHGAVADMEAPFEERQAEFERYAQEEVERQERVREMRRSWKGLIKGNGTFMGKRGGYVGVP